MRSMRALGVLALSFSAACHSCHCNPHHPIEPDPDPDPDSPVCEPGGPVTVGAEHDVATAGVGLTGVNAFDPAIAFDGENYLVVWSDWRSDGAFADIWGVRVDGAGTILDPTSFRIASTVGTQQHPAVVFDGTRFIVAWEDNKVERSNEFDIAAASVSIAGGITPLPSIATSATSETWPRLARTSDNRVIATWTNAGAIEAAFVTGGSTTPFAVTTSTLADSEPAIGVASTGEILIAYTEDNTTNGKSDVRGQLLSSSGALVGAPFDISSGVSRTLSPAIGFDGTNFIVAFVDYLTGVDIYATRVTKAGAVLDTHLEGTAQAGGIIIASVRNYQEKPSIVCGVAAGECMIGWQDTRNDPINYDVYAQRVHTSPLAPIGESFPVNVAPLKQTGPQLVASGSGYGVVWLDASAGIDAPVHVGAAILQSDGTIAVDGLVLNVGNVSQRNPAVAAAGDTRIVVYNDSASLNGDDLMFGRVSETGAVVDDVDALSTALYSQHEPVVAAMGSEFIFAWVDNRTGVADIRTTRVDDAGVPLDPDGVVVSGVTTEHSGHPRIASSGEEALVVYSHMPSTSKREIYGAIVHADGTADPPFAIANTDPEVDRPAVAWDSLDKVFVVVWQSGTQRGNPVEIRGMRVGVDGSVLDPGGVVLATGTMGHRQAARIAFAGGVGLLVYQDDAVGNHDIYAMHVTASAALGTTDAPFALTSTTSAQSSPDVTAGDEFFVAWNDSTNAKNGDVFGQFVPVQGVPSQPVLEIATSASDEGSISVAMVGTSQILAAYRMQRADLDAARVETRVIDLPKVCPTSGK